MTEANPAPRASPRRTQSCCNEVRTRMKDCLGTYLDGNASDKVGDEFKYFTTTKPTFIPQDKVYEWWSGQDMTYLLSCYYRS